MFAFAAATFAEVLRVLHTVRVQHTQLSKTTTPGGGGRGPADSDVVKASLLHWNFARQHPREALEPQQTHTNSHETHLSECLLCQKLSVASAHGTDSGEARWVAIVDAVLTVSARSCGSMEVSSLDADPPRHSDDGLLTDGRAPAHLDAAHTAPLPVPGSFTNGHSMQGLDGSLDAHARLRPVTSSERDEAAAEPLQVAAQSPASSAPGPGLAMITPDKVSAPKLPSLGVLSTQEKPVQPAASDAASRSVPSPSAACTKGEHLSEVEAPATDARTPTLLPSLAASESSFAGQPAAPTGEQPGSMPSVIDAQTPEAVLQEGDAASAGTAVHLDVTGQLTPGTLSALADLLSGVSISAAATPPSARRKQDTAVGLVYDEAMERHWGPASASVLGSVKAGVKLESASLT